MKGYDAYQQKAEIARKGGLEGAVTGFMQAASWGTPDKILRGLEARRKVLGDFEMNVAFRFGGTPYAVSERGLKLFAKEVLPVLKGWKSTAAAKPAPWSRPPNRSRISPAPPSVDVELGSVELHHHLATSSGTSGR